MCRPSLVKGYSTALAIAFLAAKASGKCDESRFCPPTKECCLHPSPRPNAPFHMPPTFIDFIVWNSLFFWCLLGLFVVFCVGGCCLWCYGKRATWRQWRCRRRGDDDQRSGRDSVGSCSAPPHYSACTALHGAPPPYTEVTSKPDLYPLVIRYSGENGKSMGNYLMVQYFRNFIVQPPIGAMSAGSTVDSISSSFLCQSATDAENSVPPPYEEPEERTRPLPTSLSGLSTATAPVEEGPPPTMAHRGCEVRPEVGQASCSPTAHTRPSNMRLTTFSRANRPVTALPDTRKYYPQEVILQQPQRYCELHYLSTDLLATGRHDSLSSDDLSQPRGSLQDFVSSDGLSRSGQHLSTSSDVSSLLGANSPDSPPRATSPTGELRDLLDKIHQLPRQRLSQYSQGEATIDGSEEESLLPNNDPTPRHPSAARPCRLVLKRPVKSKTFSLPFRHKSRANKPCHSASAPTTPLNNFPGMGTSEETNPLLSTEQNCDEVF